MGWDEEKVLGGTEGELMTIQIELLYCQTCKRSNAKRTNPDEGEEKEKQEKES